MSLLAIWILCMVAITLFGRWIDEFNKEVVVLYNTLKMWDVS